MRARPFALALSAAACNFTLDDVRPRDAGAVDAGAVDGGAAGDAGSWCALQPAHAFCADFDEGTFGVGWTNFSATTPSATRALTNDAWTSPPASARFAVQPIATSGYLDQAANVELAIDQPAEVHAAFDVQIEHLAAGEGFVLFYLGTGEGAAKNPDVKVAVTTGDGHTLDLQLDEENGGGTSTAWAASMTAGQWARVAADVTLAPPTHVRVTMTPRGAAPVVVVDRDLSVAWRPARPGMFVGAAFVGTPTSGLGVLLDDVTFDAK